MSAPVNVSEPNQPTLLVRYETDAPISATDFGALIAELGKGFDRYARGNRIRGLRLIVVGAGLGSHWVEMAVVGVGTVAGTVVKYRKEIYDFADFLGKIFDIAKGLRHEKVKPADKKIIDSINAPVATGQATQANVTVLGGAPVITINQQVTHVLWANSEDDLRVQSRKLPSPAELEFSKANRAPAVRHLNGHFGTILDVKGQWYVRLEGQEGVLNPVSLATGVHVVDEQAYLFDGSWEGRRYAIHNAHPIG